MKKIQVVDLKNVENLLLDKDVPFSYEGDDLRINFGELTESDGYVLINAGLITEEEFDEFWRYEEVVLISEY